MEISILNKGTGEVVDLDTIKTKLSKHIEELSKPDTAMWLTNYKNAKKLLSKVESLLKTKIKNETKDILEEEEFTEYEHFMVKRIFSNRFDEKALLESGDADDIEDWKRIRNKYNKPSSYIKIQ